MVQNRSLEYNLYDERCEFNVRWVEVYHQTRHAWCKHGRSEWSICGSLDKCWSIMCLENVLTWWGLWSWRWVILLFLGIWPSLLNYLDHLGPLNRQHTCHVPTHSLFLLMSSRLMVILFSFLLSLHPSHHKAGLGLGGPWLIAEHWTIWSFNETGESSNVRYSSNRVAD